MNWNEAPRAARGNSDSPAPSPPRHVSTLPDFICRDFAAQRCYEETI